MEPETNDSEEQEVTVEVVPQTVTEIIYLQDSDLTCYTPEEDPVEVKTETCEIDSVDSTKLSSKSLILDASQSFVVLSPTTDFINANTLFFNNQEAEGNDDLSAGIGEFICTICNCTCRSQSSLRAHRLIHNQQFLKCNYNCIVCGKQFDKAQTLSHHFRTSHEKPKYVCYVCNFSCRNEIGLLQHSKKHNPKKFACNMCTAVYDSYSKWIDHKKTHVTTLLYACNKCNAGFSSTSEVSCHLRTEHPRMRSVLTEKFEYGNYFVLYNEHPCFNIEGEEQEDKQTCNNVELLDEDDSDLSNNISKKRKTR